MLHNGRCDLFHQRLVKCCSCEPETLEYGNVVAVCLFKYSTLHLTFVNPQPSRTQVLPNHGVISHPEGVAAKCSAGSLQLSDFIQNNVSLL